MKRSKFGDEQIETLEYDHRRVKQIVAERSVLALTVSERVTATQRERRK
jgi:hypothetical protein